MGSGAVVLEALFYRGMLDAVPYLAPPEQRAGAAVAFLGFLLLVLLLEWTITGRFLDLGRGLEIRLRLRFLAKIARLGDRYFRSRLRSDMAERCHGVHRLRLAPELAGNGLRSSIQLAATAAGLIWLDPGVTPFVLLSAGLALLLCFWANPAHGPGAATGHHRPAGPAGPQHGGGGSWSPSAPPRWLRCRRGSAGRVPLSRDGPASRCASSGCAWWPLGTPSSPV